MHILPVTCVINEIKPLHRQSSSQFEKSSINSIELQEINKQLLPGFHLLSKFNMNLQLCTIPTLVIFKKEKKKKSKLLFSRISGWITISGKNISRISGQISIRCNPIYFCIYCRFHIQEGIPFFFLLFSLSSFITLCLFFRLFLPFCLYVCISLSQVRSFCSCISGFH